MTENPGSMPLEERRLVADIRLRELELQLKVDELKARLAAQKDRSSIWLPVWIAALSLVGGVLTTAFQGYYNRQLEADKAQSSLILKAIETGNVQDNITNLRFLIEAGLLRDPQGKITALLNRPGDVPRLPAAAGTHPVDLSLPAALEITSTDSVELLCQDPTNPSATVRLGVDRGQLPVDRGHSKLPWLSAGSHSLWWSAEIPSTTRTCEITINGDVRRKFQADSISGAILLQVR